MEEKLIYLAVPYTWNPEKSFEIANIISAKLIAEGKVVFSPISHSHCIADEMPTEKRTCQKTWMAADLPILRRCDEAVFVVINGHDGYKLLSDSKGCCQELMECVLTEIPYSFYVYNED